MGLVLAHPGVFADGVFQNAVPGPAADVITNLVVVFHCVSGLCHHENFFQFLGTQLHGLSEIGDDLGAVLSKAAVGDAFRVAMTAKNDGEIALGAPLLDLVVDLGDFGAGGVDDLDFTGFLAVFEASQILNRNAVGADHHRTSAHFVR